MTWSRPVREADRTRVRTDRFDSRPRPAPALPAPVGLCAPRQDRALSHDPKAGRKRLRPSLRGKSAADPRREGRFGPTLSRNHSSIGSGGGVGSRVRCPWANTRVTKCTTFSPHRPFLVRRAVTFEESSEGCPSTDNPYDKYGEIIPLSLFSRPS